MVLYGPTLLLYVPIDEGFNRMPVVPTLDLTAFTLPTSDFGSLALPALDPTLATAENPAGLPPAPLGASDSWISPWHDRFGLSAAGLPIGSLVSKVRALALSDVAGTLYLQESVANTVLTLTGTGVVSTVTQATAEIGSVATNNQADTTLTVLTRRYWRVAYTNGATPQTVFLLNRAVTHGFGS